MTGRRSATSCGAYLIDLPVDGGDPLGRLTTIAEEFEAHKEMAEIPVMRRLVAATQLVPQPLFGLAAARVANSNLFDLIVSNVPGPPFPLYFRGGRMRQTFPVMPLVGRTRISFAVMSYLDQIDFGIAADFDTVPDLEILAKAIPDSLDRLLKATSSL